MLRRALFAASLLTLAGATSASAESSTVRIEPRPYYGAVVTLEQGVRVWRPLPPTRHMIINPTGAPVSVNITDVRETVNHTGYPHGAAAAAAASSGGGYGGAPWGFTGRQNRHGAKPVSRRHAGGGYRPGRR